jgi:hypothetical protein
MWVRAANARDMHIIAALKKANRRIIEAAYITESN